MPMPARRCATSHGSNHDELLLLRDWLRAPAESETLAGMKRHAMPYGVWVASSALSSNRAITPSGRAGDG